jgi:hypothetical protein
MAICRNIQNNDLYRFLGGNRFRNLRTGKEGEVSDELAQSTLKINLEATALINENQLLEEMIKVLNLKFDNIKKEKL